MTRPKSKVPPHAFQRDPDLPPDQRGLYVCGVPGCRLIGEPNDAHHTLPAVPAQAEHRGRYDHDDDGGEA